MRANILLIASIIPCPYEARKKNTQLAKYLLLLYVKPENEVYIFTKTGPL